MPQPHCLEYSCVRRFTLKNTHSALNYEEIQLFNPDIPFPPPPAPHPPAPPRDLQPSGDYQRERERGVTNERMRGVTNGLYPEYGELLLWCYIEHNADSLIPYTHIPTSPQPTHPSPTRSSHTHIPPTHITTHQNHINCPA